MREVVLRVELDALDEILDRVLPLAPGGVRQSRSGRRHVELRMRGDELPEIAEIAAAVSPLSCRISEQQVSDDWRRRRLDDYRAETIGGRLVVRPSWAPVPGDGLIDISLVEGDAFGEGTHPTTQTCLEWLLALPPAGSFADLGCGSGVLAILASTLGWRPVFALDAQPSSIEVATENAERNGASIEARVVDLSAEPPPPADGFAANLPAAVHLSIASGWGPSAPSIGLLSGFGPAEARSVFEAYAACGLRERRQLERFGWVIAEVHRS